MRKVGAVVTTLLPTNHRVLTRDVSLLLTDEHFFAPSTRPVSSYLVVCLHPSPEANHATSPEAATLHKVNRENTAGIHNDHRHKRSRSNGHGRECITVAQYK